MFDVYLQGQLVLENRTIDPTGTAGPRYTVREFDHILCGDALLIHLVPRTASTVLSGIELVRKDDESPRL